MSSESTADGYAEKVVDLLDDNPYLRAVADIGCGTGYVTSYLQALDVSGVNP